MYCSSCGNNLTGNENFCPSCGQKPNMNGEWIGMDKICAEAGDIPPIPDPHQQEEEQGEGEEQEQGEEQGEGEEQSPINPPYPITPSNYCASIKNLSKLSKIKDLFSTNVGNTALANYHEMYESDRELEELGEAIESLVHWTVETNMLMDRMAERYGELAASTTTTRRVANDVEELADNYDQALDDMIRFR